MDSWIAFVALLAAWFALQMWLLPKLGVGT